MRKFLARLWPWRRKRSYATEVIADSPWGYWPLGSDLADVSGNDHHMSDEAANEGGVQ